MGAEQAANTMVNVTEASMKRKGEVDQAKLDALKQKIIDNFERQMDVFTTSAHLLDDGVIDPRDTRAVLAYALSICREADQRQPHRMQFSVARP
jgi:geranyl-CoA carboxylase beta subunit